MFKWISMQACPVQTRRGHVTRLRSNPFLESSDRKVKSRKVHRPESPDQNANTRKFTCSRIDNPDHEWWELVQNLSKLNRIIRSENYHMKEIRFHCFSYLSWQIQIQKHEKCQLRKAINYLLARVINGGHGWEKPSEHPGKTSAIHPIPFYIWSIYIL